MTEENGALQQEKKGGETAEKEKKEGVQRFRRPRRSTKNAAAKGEGRQLAKQAAEGEKQQKPKQPAKGKEKQSENLETAVAKNNVKAPRGAKTAKPAQSARAPRQTKGGRGGKKPTVRIIPLGGLNEIGKNMTVFECGDDMFILDCGLAFPDEEMFGVDMVIPDFQYVEKNVEKLRGVVLTHGHEDHIGSIPYLLKSVNVPVYGTRLTLGLVEGKLREHGIFEKCDLRVVKPRDIVQMGCMAVEFIRVNHSIPDACAMAIHTPAGVIIHSGDFKVDYTPIEGDIIDLARFGELGSSGVLALMLESTNAERPGSSKSERKVGDSFEVLFRRAENKRIIIASFASNIHRVQQIVDYSEKYGRKIAVSGRSMVNVVGKAMELGYLRMPEGMLIDIDAIGRYPQEKVVIITTGSQGEPMSALTRMAMGDHRKVTVTPDDFIIISANPIPGNEKLVNRVVNELLRLGAEVVYEAMYEVHASGHACQDELRLMIGLVKPKFFIPVHGEYKHLIKNAGLAMSLGIPEKNVLIADIGKVIELTPDEMKVTGTVPSGRVLVDGLGVGDVGSIVLRDRKHLGQDGLIIVVTSIETQTGQILAGPDIVSRGFVYVREAEEMMNEARKICRNVVEKCMQNHTREWGIIKSDLKDVLSEYFYAKTKRKPMILPIIQEI